MTPNHFFAFAGLCWVSTSTALSQDAPPPAPPGRKAPAHDATLIHKWPVTVAFGFNAEDRLLIYSGNRRIFEKHDLTASNANAQVSGWNYVDPSMLTSGALSGDRRVLATVSIMGMDRSRIFLWNSGTGGRIGPSFATTDVAHVAFSPDGKSLAGVAAHDGTVRVWDATTGEIQWSQSLPDSVATTWTGAHYSPDGRYLAARNGGGVVLWSVAERGPAGRSTVTGEQVSYMSVSPDWKLALGSILSTNAGGEAARISLLDLSDPTKPRPAHKALSDKIVNAMEAGAFSADGRLLALHLRDGSLRVWYTASGCVVHQTRIAAGRVMRLAISPNARVAATLEHDPGEGEGRHGVVRLWDLATGQMCGPPQPAPGAFGDWRFDDESRFLWIAFAESSARPVTLVWKLPAPNAAPAKSTSRARAHPTPATIEAAKAPESIDVREAGFKSPRAVIWDKVADVYLVSNIAGHPLAKDSNGFISRVRPDATVESLKWITGTTDNHPLHAPKGMAITHEVLWVADIDVVRKFDRVTGQPLGVVPITGASSLDGITGWAHGDEGSVNVMDTGERHDGNAGVTPNREPRLASIATKDGKVTVHSMTELAALFRELRLGETGVSEDDPVHSDPAQDLRSASPYGIPRGLGFAGAGFALASGDRPYLYLLVGRDGGGMTEVYRFPKGRLDGVVVLFWERMSYRDDLGRRDNSAGLLVSSWEGRCVYAWSSPPGARITELVSDVRAPGSLGFDLRRNRVLIPLCLDEALLLRPGPP
ncbi:MAG: hypothetical protein ACKVYV_10585 [Limisphaerales bacterium]